MSIDRVFESGCDFFGRHIKVLAVVSESETGETAPKFRRLKEVVALAVIGATTHEVDLRLLTLIIGVGDWSQHPGIRVVPQTNLIVLQEICRHHSRG